MNIKETTSDMPRVTARGKGRLRRRDIVYLPTRQNHSKSTVIAGIVCRALLAAAFVAGICLFVADAYGIVPDKTGAAGIFYSALFFSAAITLLCRGGIPSAVGASALIGGVLARLAVVSVDIVGIIRHAAAAIHNTVIDRFIYAGLTTIHTLYIESDGAGIYAEEDICGIGLMLLVLVVAALLAPVIVKRCSAIYLTVVTAIFIVPACLYNIMRTNWGFALLTAAIAGTFVLWTHDRRYTRPSRKKRLIADDEVIPLFGDEENTYKKQKRARREKRRGKTVADDSVYRLESNADRRRRLSKERAESRRLAREEKRAARMHRKECRRAEHLDRRAVTENAALGGITGLVTMVLAMLIIALPAYFVSESDPGIPYVSDMVDNVRKYVTAYLWSEQVDLNHVSSGGVGQSSEGPRPTETVYPKYEDIVLATVEVPYNTPVYLRSWIGTRYHDDHWYSASLSDIDKYKDRFGELFTPEMITENYYNAMHPDYSYYAESSAYGDNTRIGFIIERVSVTRKNGSTTLLYLPSFVRPSTGILAYNSGTQSLLPYSYYFDGVWTSRFFFEGTQYTTESLVTTMRYPELGLVYANGIKEYFATIELLRSGEPDNMIGHDTAMIDRYIATYEERFESTYGIELGEKSLLYRYMYEMSEDERQALLEGALLEESYSEYVTETYLQTDESDVNAIRAIAQTALREAGILWAAGSIGTDDYHEVIMALIDYLADNYTYSNVPPEITKETTGDDIADPEVMPDDIVTDEYTETEEQKVTALMEFLTETHTGYCVQFASSLTLMLRSLGIPARYCEGFIVSDFKINSASENAGLDYYSDVLDSNAHAWVEVYYDGIGWVQYEATPTYHDAIYGSGVEEPKLPTPDLPDAPVVKDPVPSGVVQDQPEEDEGLPAEEDPHARAVFATIIASSAAGAIIVITVISYFVMLKLRSDKVLRARAALIERCRDTESEMTEEELHRFAHEMDLGIFDVYRALGLPPDIGELSDEYAARLDGAIGNASRKGTKTVLELISREEFGGSIHREGLATLAEYYDDLTRNVYDGLSLGNKFIMRGIRRVV